MKNYLNLISKKKNQVTMIVKTVDVSLMKSTMSIRFVITVDLILKKVNSPSAVAAIKNLLHTLHYEMRPTACINNLLAAGFCERWAATHEREGFSGWPPCQRVAVQRKKLAANVLWLGVCYFALQILQALDKINRQNNSTKPMLVAGAV